MFTVLDHENGVRTLTTRRFATTRLFATRIMATTQIATTGKMLLRLLLLLETLLIVHVGRKLNYLESFFSNFNIGIFLENFSSTDSDGGSQIKIANYQN